MPSHEVMLTMGDSPDEGSYTFVCPSCGDFIEKRADGNIVKLLMAVDGVKLDFDQGDWDAAFSDELTCDGTHRWDFPVRMGQKCVCGQKEWGEDE